MSTGLGARGLEIEILEIHAARKRYAKNLLKEAAEALSLGRTWINETPPKEKLSFCGRARICWCQAERFDLRSKQYVRMAKPAQEHRAADSAEAPGLPGAGHLAS